MNVDVEILFVSNKLSSGENYYKYFFGYLHIDYKVKPLDIVLS